jgi:DMSO reductase family type II enzyme heme b subunit
MASSRVPILLASGLLAVSAFPGAPRAATAQDVQRGKAVYDRWCVECHGAEGRGDGSAADRMLPRPRDFVQARYQVRTTASGELPTDDDLRRLLEAGMPGTAMPAWPNLGQAEREDVIAYIKTFSPFFEDAPPAAMDFGSDPGGGDATLESGREAYRRLECWKCHGDSGRGNGQSAPTLEDWRNLPIRAADLTEPWAFNGGMGVHAVHTRLLTGLDGTPMPAYSDALESEVVTAEELWHLARFVDAMGPGGEPEVSELIAAARSDGDLPGSPDDPVWDAVRPSYVPLVGQVIEAPRQFSPTVDGAWVRAMHDGEELAVLVEWNDPSESPDAGWDEWQAKIAPVLYADGAPVASEAPMPDGLAIQFPPAVPDGMERPYLLMGDARNPVYLWHWDSEGGVTEMRARGLGELEPLDGGWVDGAAAWDDGRWRLMIRRPLSTGDPAVLTFEEGVAIPLGIFAWDGSSAEDAIRGSISSWYFVYLEEPKSAGVYLIPLLAAALTGVLGFAVAARAQRRAEGSLEEAAQTA